MSSTNLSTNYNITNPSGYSYPFNNTSNSNDIIQLQSVWISTPSNSGAQYFGNYLLTAQATNNYYFPNPFTNSNYCNYVIVGTIFTIYNASDVSIVIAANSSNGGPQQVPGVKYNPLLYINGNAFSVYTSRNSYSSPLSPYEFFTLGPFKNITFQCIGIQTNYISYNGGPQENYSSCTWVAIGGESNATNFSD